jgi:PAS domain S-box-containing protein
MLELFIEYAPAALAMFDRDMRYVAASRRWKQDYGLGDRDIVGLSHYDVFPEIGDRLKAIHRRGLAGEVLRDECASFARMDGSVQYVRWEMRPWMADGKIGGILIFTEDITAAKKSESAQRRLADILRAMHGISRLIAEESHGESLLQRACAVLTETRGYESAWAVLIDSSGEARVAGRAGQAAGLEDFERNFEAGYRPTCYSNAMRDSGAVAIHDRGGACAGCPLARGTAGDAAIARAIRRDGRDYGFIAASLPTEMAADEEELGLFAEATEDLALALYAIEREERRLRAEAALEERAAEARAGKAKLEAALESMNDAVFISDADGRLVDFNSAFATFHKFKEKAECARTLAEYPGFLDVFMADGSLAPLEMWAIPRALRGEIGGNVEYSLRRKDTGESWVGSYSFAPIRGEGGAIVGSVVVGRDVTDRKRADEALRNSELLFSTIFHYNPAPISISRPGGIIVDVNDAFVRLCGYERAEILGKTTRELGLWETPSRGSVMEELKDKGRVEGFEIAGRRKSGEPLDLIISLELVELGGEPCVLGIGTDITERKRSEDLVAKALREKEALLRELFHRTRNNMLTIVSMMSLSSASRPGQGLSEFVERMRQRILAMALAHERLYIQKDLSRIDLRGFIEALAEMLVSETDSGGRILRRVTGGDVEVHFDTAVPLSLILTELISNTLRHSFPNGSGGEISISIERLEGGGLALDYSNDGLGPPEGFDLSTSAGYGLLMVRSLVTQLHGALSIRPGPGIRYRLVFRDDSGDAGVL